MTANMNFHTQYFGCTCLEYNFYTFFAALECTSIHPKARILTVSHHLIARGWLPTILKGDESATDHWVLTTC